MREINVSEIENAVRDLCIQANLKLPDALVSCIKKHPKRKSPPQAKRCFATW